MWLGEATNILIYCDKIFRKKFLTTPFDTTNKKCDWSVGILQDIIQYVFFKKLYNNRVT